MAVGLRTRKRRTGVWVLVGPGVLGVSWSYATFTNGQRVVTVGSN